MKQASGFESLIDALKQSGFDMGAGFGGPAGASGEGGAGSSSGNGAGGQGSESPFTAFSGGRGNKGGNGGGIPEFSFGDKMGQMGKKALIITAVLVLLIVAAAYWWFHPPINIHSVDTWMFVVVFILLPLFLLWNVKSRTYETGNSKVDPNRTKAKAFKVASWIPVAIALVGVVGAVASLSVFPGNAAKYASVLDTQDADFAQDIQQVDYSEIPIIDRDSAALLGNRAMGNIPEYVSQFEIAGTYSQINYQGTPVRVSPLGYADLFKWLQNREQGIPAYVIVDMTSQDAQVVRLDSEHAIKYSESEPLARNIDRYVQLKYPFYMFGEKSFEIDDDGNAWWICPVRDFTIGLFGGETVSRAVLVNAATGECQDMAVEDVPQWVDHVYPANLIIQQYNWHGKYTNGWLNSWLGQNGVVQTTPGTDGSAGYNYIAKDDDVWLYTGVTSATGDESIVGFVLVNQRTAEAHFYSCAGATESSAMQSAEGQVQNLRYEATFPILINVNNTPTYFMALKDNAGLVKKYAMVDIQSYQNVAVGDTVADTQKSYLSLIAANGTVANTSSVSDSALEATGVIKTIATAVIEGNSHFYVTLEGDSKIYDFALPGMIEIVQYAQGDTVTFKYVEGDPTCSAQSIEAAKSAKANSADAAGASSADIAKASDEAKTSDGVAKDGAASSASSDASAEQKTA